MLIKTIIVIVCAIAFFVASLSLDYNSNVFWQRILWYFFVVGTITLIIFQGYENFASNKDLISLRTQVANFREYGQVATWNFKGAQSISKDFSFPGTISGWTEGFVKDQNGKKMVRYDDEAISHYKNIVSQHPNYPFPYYFLAEAYRMRGDKIWHEYASKAMNILKITTSIPNHAPDHDDALANLRIMMAEEAK
jgi:hypothetical protein